MLNQPAELDRVLHALADPTRRAVVERLGRGPASVRDLAAPFAISLPGLLQHLAVLETSGLVVSEKRGRVRTCHLAPDGLRRLDEWVAAQKAEWEARLDRLGAYLAATEGDDTP
jgi:DNA-binding transcriptional ArsR family regulator